MSGLCKVMIIGNLGRDPEMRYTATGKPVTSFTVAVNRNYSTPEGERKEETEWFRVTAWDRLAETCNEVLAKGRKVYVEGRLQTRTWEGQDGQKRTSIEIIASNMILLDRPKPPAIEGESETEPDIEEIPF